MRPHRIILEHAKRLVVLALRKKVDFVIAGTAKGGTTALDLYLREHPDIGMADRKELRFFDDDKIFEGRRPPYASYHVHFWNVRSRKLWGEATPRYMYWPETPERLWNYNPRMKLIMILRNPIERAYSDWNMKWSRKKEDMSFWHALQHEKEMSEKASEQRPPQNYVKRGMYAEQLQRIWNYFPKDQTLILRSEDLKNKPQGVLDRVCHFLGVAPPVGVQKKEAYALPYAVPMNEREREFLREALLPEIKKLEKLLGWDCSDWLAS
jgi:hypothetical protein